MQCICVILIYNAIQYNISHTYKQCKAIQCKLKKHERYLREFTRDRPYKERRSQLKTPHICCLEPLNDR